MTMTPRSAMTTPAPAPVVAQRRQEFQRLLCLPLSKIVDQKDALASTTLTSSNQEEAAALHVAPHEPTEP